MRGKFVRVGLIGVSASLLLAGCSSTAESEVTPTVTPSPTESVLVVAVLAQDACDDYFALEKQCNSVAEERSSLESLVAKLTDEKENLEAQSEQHKTAALVVEAELRTKKDETKAALDESRKANQRLDEMLAYCEKLKKVNQC